MIPTKALSLIPDLKFDIILNLASLNPTSKNLINKDFLNALNKDGLFINPARGKIVNQSDLLSFLGENPQVTAYLDVFENEPEDFEMLKKVPNIKLSSHQAGVSY